MKIAQKEARHISRRLILALVTMLLCIALLIGGTYALFSASSIVTNHLVAGNLTAKLVRESYSYDTLDESGYIVHHPGTETNTDFSAATNENLFGLAKDAYIAPGCKFTANMALTNEGTVAFNYWIVIQLKGDSNALAEQLQVTVQVGEQKTEQSLSKGLSIGSDKNPIGVVELGGSKATFSVTVEFTDNDDNNAAEDQQVYFDFTVFAMQAVRKA